MLCNGLWSIADSMLNRTDITLMIRLPQDRRMDFCLDEITGRACLIQLSPAKQPGCDVLYSVSIKQVGLASNNTLRKRLINECQGSDDEGNSTKVNIE